MTGSYRIEPKVSVRVNDMDTIEDPSMTANAPADNNINNEIKRETSAANITQSERAETDPDGDSEILHLFTVGNKPIPYNYPEREGSEDSEKEKNKTISTRQKRLNLSSKVGHTSGNIGQTIENSKPRSPAVSEKRSSESDSNGKVSRSARYVWVSIKRKLSRRRGSRETTVKEIHISPDQTEDKWVSRSLQDHSHSTSNSTSSSRAGSSGSRNNMTKKSNLDVSEDTENITQHSLHSPHKR